jgi:hypothetical protein
VLDFDSIDDWGPCLSVALQRHLPKTISSTLSGAAPEFIEDALRLLFELTEKDSIIDAALAWVRSTQIVGYHGTRLTDAEVASIEQQGLLPLDANTRRTRLARVLSRHPRWADVANGLDAAIQALGEGGKAGQRENQIHLTLSRTGLIEDFNHYLNYGAEFDQHVAHALLGAEGKELLRLDGQPRVVHVAVPGDAALEAAHPSLTIEELRARGDVPNLIDAFLKSWSYRLASPDFQARKLQLDSGMDFRTVVPSEWFRRIETRPDSMNPR